MEEGTTAVLTADTAKLVGRTYLNDDVLWAAFSGAGAEFIYTGKKLDITIVGDAASTAGNADNYARVAIYVDGERVIDDMLDEKEKTYTAFESDSEKSVDVQIIKLSECAMSTIGIKPIKLGEGEKIEPAKAKDLKIEFIGDSITCGYGVDDPDKEHHFKTSTEDVTKAYAYKTAQALDADYSMVSISGHPHLARSSTGARRWSTPWPTCPSSRARTATTTRPAPSAAPAPRSRRRSSATFRPRRSSARSAR